MTHVVVGGVGSLAQNDSVVGLALMKLAIQRPQLLVFAKSLSFGKSDSILSVSNLNHWAVPSEHVIGLSSYVMRTDG